MTTVGTGAEATVRITMTPNVVVSRRSLTLTPRPATLNHGEEAEMFTGIVEELGTVEALEDQGDAVRLTVRGPLVTSDAAR